MAVIRSETEDDVELGAEFARFRVREGDKLYHEVLRRFAHAFDQEVFGVHVISINEALAGEGAFVLSVNRDVNVWSASGIDYRFDRAEVILSVSRRHEATKTLEVAIAFRAIEAAVLGMNVSSLVIDLPNFDAGVGNRVAFDIGHFSVEMSDGSDGGRDLVVDADEIVIGIKGKFIRVEWPLGHGRGGGQGFGEGAGSGEEKGRAESGAAEEGATVALGTGGIHHRMILLE